MQLKIDYLPGIVIFKFIIPKDKIGYFKFILEGYGEFGFQSSEKNSEVITWQIMEDYARPAQKLLESLLHEK